MKAAAIIPIVESPMIEFIFLIAKFMLFIIGYSCLLVAGMTLAFGLWALTEHLTEKGEDWIRERCGKNEKRN